MVKPCCVSLTASWAGVGCALGVGRVWGDCKIGLKIELLPQNRGKSRRDLKGAAVRV